MGSTYIILHLSNNIAWEILWPHFKMQRLSNRVVKWLAQGHKISEWCHLHSEKVMVPHSSTLAWKIPWTEEPGGLQSMGSPNSQTGLSNYACAHTHTHTHIHTFSLVVLSVLCQIFPLLDIKFLENRNLFPSLIPPHQCFITPQPFKKMAVMLNCIPNFWPVPTVEAWVSTPIPHPADMPSEFHPGPTEIKSIRYVGTKESQ